MEQSTFSKKEEVEGNQPPQAIHNLLFSEQYFAPLENQVLNQEIQPSSSSISQEQTPIGQDQLAQEKPSENHPQINTKVDTHPGYHLPYNKDDDYPNFSKRESVKNFTETEAGPIHRITPSQKSNSIRCLGCYFDLVLVGTILGFLIYILSYFHEKREITLDLMSGALTNIASNLETDLIIELTLVNAGSACPTGLTKLTIGRWAGTNRGCDCTDHITFGRCSDDEYFCGEIDGIDGFDLTIWKGSEWCAKRATFGIEFIQQVVCPSGFQECTPGICIINSFSCPITSMILSDTDPTGTSDQLADPSDGRRYLVLERTIGERPLIGLKISLNDIPCFNLNEFPIGSTGSYLLYHEKAEGCNKYGLDSVFSSAIDSQKQTRVLVENGGAQQIWDLPFYAPILTETQAVFTARYRIEVENKEECMNVETETIAEAGNAASKINTVVSVISLIGIIVHSILVVAILINILINTCRYAKKAIFGKNSIVYFVWSLVGGGLQLVIYIVMLVLVRSRHAAMKKAQDYFILLKENYCFRIGQPATVIVDYHYLIHEVTSRLSNDSLIILILTICFVASNLFFVMIRKKY